MKRIEHKSTRKLLFFARPADRTLKAYKAWINGMVAAIGVKEEADFTEAKWRKSWRDFWGTGGARNAKPKRKKTARKK